MYSINGNVLTVGLDGTAPTSHQIGKEPASKNRTIGGVVAVEGPSGPLHTFTLYYDRRTTAAIDTLLDYLDLESSPIVILSLPDIRSDPITRVARQLTNIVCTAEKPDIKTDGARMFTESFQIIFTEMYSQI